VDQVEPPLLRHDHVMELYDPELIHNATEWLELDEGERALLVEQYHRDARIALPKIARRIHAITHTIVENQLALDDQAIVRATLNRLRKDVCFRQGCASGRWTECLPSREG